MRRATTGDYLIIAASIASICALAYAAYVTRDNNALSIKLSAAFELLKGNV